MPSSRDGTTQRSIGTRLKRAPSWRRTRRNDPYSHLPMLPLVGNAGRLTIASNAHRAPNPTSVPTRIVPSGGVPALPTYVADGPTVSAGVTNGGPDATGAVEVSIIAVAAAGGASGAGDATAGGGAGAGPIGTGGAGGGAPAAAGVAGGEASSANVVSRATGAR